ncbi:MAG: iron donor protein CyaY [Alphaproteobacteria bacterium]|nr:iron donor protein CyaY [Alphaproteobacteria bacterium]
MNESTFVREAVSVLDRIEEAVDASGCEIDIERKGEGVLALEFENGSQIIVNLQAPMRQIWIAAKAGGFHFVQQDGRWVDTRSGAEFFAALSAKCRRRSGSASNWPHDGPWVNRQGPRSPRVLPVVNAVTRRPGAWAIPRESARQKGF